MSQGDYCGLCVPCCIELAGNEDSSTCVTLGMVLMGAVDHDMAHIFIELCKLLHHDKAVIHEGMIAGRHHRCNEHELGQTPRDGKGQGDLVCCSPWGCKESDMTGQLSNNCRLREQTYGYQGKR